MQKGDHVQLKGPRNPYKGNISMGKTYEVLAIVHGTMGETTINIMQDNDTMSWYYSREFKVKYCANEPAPMDDAEYNEIMKIQDSLDLAKLDKYTLFQD